MSNTDDGYIKIYRKFFDHFLWTEDREFTKAEAWIWLLKEARYKKGKNKKLIGDRLIEWSRGEVPASLRYLKKAWNWGSTTKVQNFLDLLRNEGMIKTRKAQGQNIVSICNYSTYNAIENIKKHTEKTEEKQAEDTGSTQEAQNSKKGNKGKKGKKGKNKSVGTASTDIPQVTDEETWDDATRLAEHLKESICEYDPDHRYNKNPPSLDRWVKEIDRALRLDGRTFKQMEFIIDYVFSKNTRVADFWKPNIQSGKRLRQQFDKIKEQIRSEHKPKKNSKPTLRDRLDAFDDNPVTINPVTV